MALVRDFPLFPLQLVALPTDRIAGFADYTQNFTRDDARDVLGATLPPEDSGAGLYGDAQTARVSDAFQRLFLLLAERRPLPDPGEVARIAAEPMRAAT